MGVLIAFAIFLASSLGLGFFLSRKLPELKSAPEEEGKSVKDLQEAARAWLRNQKSTQYVKSPDLLLEKALSTARVASLRAEAKTGELLEKLRQRSQARRSWQQNQSEGFEDGYWKQLREKEDVPAGHSKES